MQSKLLSWLRLLFITIGSLVAGITVLTLVLLFIGSYKYHFGFDQQEWLATGKLLLNDKEARAY